MFIVGVETPKQNIFRKLTCYIYFGMKRLEFGNSISDLFVSPRNQNVPSVLVETELKKFPGFE